MGKFIAGVIITLLVIFAGSYIYVHYGFMDLSADAPYNKIEVFYVHGMLDRWARRYGPTTPNPVEATDANMIDGVKLYKQDCAVCHGSPQNPIAEIGRSLYPRAPQFMKNPPTDMTDGMIFQITKHGVSRTGMPAWSKNLNDTDIWKLTAFLKRMDKLPPAVDAEWKSAPVSAPLAPAPGQTNQAPPPEVQHNNHKH
jgi:thiosulfate dehydrogenase